MSDIRKLINQIAIAEAQLHTTQFLAPCVKGGRVRTRVAGMVYTFTPKPNKFEGWGIFQPVDQKTATVVEEAELPQIAEYLQHFPQIRLRLAHQLQKQTWLAYSVNEADVRQRLKIVKPIAVHLVTEGIAFEQIIARWNGQSCWFEEVDRRTDPVIVETLQSAVKQLIPAEELQFKGITPEIRTVYELATRRIEGFTQPQQDEKRLRKALQMGGGELNQFHDRNDYWTVDWTTADGVRHSSAIAKTDLTVVSSGICLSGRDRDFDLQSLVAVIEQQE
ncbi:hypothetical protein [Nostoc sp. 'Peltigera membranacea cyanobiont' 232]|uniref:hypothetical protein n=1 Tax=Nostoc sp. 'Peltigera membranacea cyanobiont' 232 TaxID=2014531 RepID=UPI000B959B26|nr:hypothetical protein [Nostoc sp. 'Peltigera membranacea cyanobiont' 232]OYE05790.1 hypothetical protein CDG79_05840 [Nostoc sp. 'Peltigera membranacea cyanobiont' 232]